MMLTLYSGRETTRTNKYTYKVTFVGYTSSKIKFKNKIQKRKCILRDVFCETAIRVTPA